MKSNDCVLLGTGLVLGAVVGGAYGAGLIAAFGHDPIRMLKNWQTLAGAALALVAAGGTIWAVWHQTDFQHCRADDERRRRGRAARAVMPLVLMELIDYTKDCSNLLSSLK